MREPELGRIQVKCQRGTMRTPAELREHPLNPNTHPPEQVEALALALRVQGWRKPIVVSLRSGFVTRGHGLLEAARRLGLEAVPVDEQEYATEAEEVADLIADNALARMATMDLAALAEAFGELEGKDEELAGTGYTPADVKDVLALFAAGEFQQPDPATALGAAAGEMPPEPAPDDRPWIYARWYGNPEGWEEARKILREFFIGPHELHAGALLDALRRTAEPDEEEERA